MYVRNQTSYLPAVLDCVRLWANLSMDIDMHCSPWWVPASTQAETVHSPMLADVLMFKPSSLSFNLLRWCSILLCVLSGGAINDFLSACVNPNLSVTPGGGGFGIAAVRPPGDILMSNTIHAGTKSPTTMDTKANRPDTVVNILNNRSLSMMPRLTTFSIGLNCDN